MLRNNGNLLHSDCFSNNDCNLNQFFKNTEDSENINHINLENRNCKCGISLNKENDP